jgi:hypothetical protein
MDLNATQQVLCRAVKSLSIRAVRGVALLSHPLIEFMAHVPARHPAAVQIVCPEDLSTS